METFKYVLSSGFNLVQVLTVFFFFSESPHHELELTKRKTMTISRTITDPTFVTKYD